MSGTLGGDDPKELMETQRAGSADHYMWKQEQPPLAAERDDDPLEFRAGGKECVKQVTHAAVHTQ